MMPLLCSGLWVEPGLVEKDGRRETAVMPGVDFKAVCQRVPMAKVLELVGFQASGVRGNQLHGPCPVHRSRSTRSRTFSVNTDLGLCCCHKCGFAGNQIHLWGRLKNIRKHPAAIDLCREAGVEVPWIERW